MNSKKQKEKDRRRARKLAEEAWEAVHQDNLDLAAKIIRRAVATQVDNPVLWNDQGVILSLRREDEPAEEAFRAALSLAPTFAEPYAHLAAIRLRQGYPRKALALMTEAVKHAPQNATFAERLEAYRSLVASDAPPEPPHPAAKTPPEKPQPFGLSADWLTRLGSIPWDQAGEQLTRDGCALLNGLLAAPACEHLRGLWEDETRFAKTVVMNRADFGRGEYRYFRAPLPDLVEGLRRAVYPHVARVANDWQRLLGEEDDYPLEWEEFRRHCHDAGQTTPTPILLKYGPGGFNALHRDLRGKVFFPIQMAVVLSPRADPADPESAGFRGGDFLLCDVPERKKARRRQIPAGLGDAVLFCTRDRLVRVGGAYGLQPVQHGVTEITAGTRFVLGVPFHEYR